MDVNHFSDEQKAGQRIMAGFDGTELNNDLKFLIDTIKVGGIILFSRNISEPAQVKKLTLSAQAYAASCGQPPLFIAIDQEGGEVARLKEPFTQFPDGCPGMTCVEDAQHFARITAKELRSIGVNMDMAPVMDVAPEDIDSIMRNRSFGHDPQRVATMGENIIHELQKNRVMAVAKHFPGIGRTVMDSHLDLPVLEVALEMMVATDLIPFKASIDHDVAGIMLSHILYNKIDPEWPASISKKIAKNLLRDQMGYDGLVLTDDLDMGAIKKHYNIQSVINQILTAEIDIILICKLSSNIKDTFDIVLKEMKDSEKIRRDGKKSVNRVMGLKGVYL